MAKKDKKDKKNKGKEPAEDPADAPPPQGDNAAETADTAWQAHTTPWTDRPKHLEDVRNIILGSIQRATHSQNPQPGTVHFGPDVSTYQWRDLAENFGRKGFKLGNLPREVLCLLYAPDFNYKLGEVPPTAATHTCGTAKKSLFAARRRRARHFTPAPQPADLTLPIAWALEVLGHIKGDDEDSLVEVGVPLGHHDTACVFARQVKVPPVPHVCPCARRVPAVLHYACHPSGAVQHLTPPQVQERSDRRVHNRLLPITLREVKAAMKKMREDCEALVESNQV